MNALQDRDPMDETPQKHNCEEWRYEGIGCARCSPVMGAADGLLSLLRDAEVENARLREQVAALRAEFETIASWDDSDDGYVDEWTQAAAFQMIREIARRVLATPEDWRIHEAKEATRDD